MAKRRPASKGMAVELVGADDLGEKFRRLGGVGTADILETIVKAVAEPVRKAASDMAPRRTGNLAGNIKTATLEKKKDKCVVGIGPGKDAWYGIFPELGTSHSAAQPYLRPSFDQNRENSKAGIRDGLREKVEEVAKG